MKIVESKIWYYGEKLYDLIIISLLCFVFSIPIITLGPAIYAGVRTINDIENGSSQYIFYTYINYFKEKFISNMLTFNSLLVILLVALYNIMGALETMNFIAISTNSFVMIECILIISVIFFVSKTNPIDLIIYSFILSNRILPKIILNLFECILIILCGIMVPLLLPTIIGLCLFISYKNIYNSLHTVQ